MVAEDISRLKKEEAAYQDDQSKSKKGMHVQIKCGRMMGLTFVFIGIGLMLANFTALSFQNWWAMFLFVPAVMSLAKGAQSYSRNGYLTREAAGTISGSLFLLFLGSMFLFGLEWGTFWPGILIVIGLGSLIKGMGR